MAKHNQYYFITIFYHLLDWQVNVKSRVVDLDKCGGVSEISVRQICILQNLCPKESEI